MDKIPVTILIIDGDAASRNYLSAMLQKEGYLVLTSSLGREGLISAWKDHPEIIIFDPVLPDLPGVDLISRLRLDRRTAKIPCIALSSRENEQEMSALLAAGCNEYLVKSGDAIPRLFNFLPRLLNTESMAPTQGKLIAFLSAKGGSGTSSLCANIAMCAAGAKPDKRIAVLDLVLPIGSIANIVGYEGAINLVSTALQKPEDTGAVYFKENLPRIPGWFFYLLAGSPDPASANQLAVDRVAAIVNALLESHDYLFIDLGRSLSRISLPLLQRANALVLVIGTDLATCTLTQITFEYMKSLGIDARRILAIQNRSVGLEGLTKPEAEKKIGLPIQVTIPHLADNFTVANNRHEPFTYRFPNDSTSMTFKRIAVDVLATSDKQYK